MLGRQKLSQKRTNTHAPLVIMHEHPFYLLNDGMCGPLSTQIYKALIPLPLLQICKILLPLSLSSYKRLMGYIETVEWNGQ